MTRGLVYPQDPCRQFSGNHVAWWLATVLLAWANYLLSRATAEIKEFRARCLGTPPQSIQGRRAATFPCIPKNLLYGLLRASWGPFSARYWFDRAVAREGADAMVEHLRCLRRSMTAAARRLVVAISSIGRRESQVHRRRSIFAIRFPSLRGPLFDFSGGAIWS